MFRNYLLKTIVLSAFALLFQIAFSQEKRVTGKVTDSKDGNGIADVSVTVKGSTTGTTTNRDGTFAINVPSSATTLVFSSVGYATQQVPINGKSSIDVSLQASSSNLNEVVVIGYGTARKKDLTGSVATVTSKDFVKGPITSPEQLIAGKVAGVQITPNNGMPGSGSRIRIRGGTSLRASNDPLIVIDGVPLDNNDISGASNPLALINPNDIESVTILKDASAAAIYGNRAANGVILITTKKGAVGKLQVSFSTLNTVSRITNKVNVLSTDQFTNLVNQKGSAADIAMLGNASTDWQDEIYRTAFSTDNNISLRGGIPKVPYRFSLGYLDQNGILKRSNLQRTSVGLNLSPKFFGDHLSVNANGKYANSKNFFANQAAISAAVYFDPTKPIYSGKQEYGGYYEWISSGTTLNGLSQKNPVGLLNQRDDKSDVNRFIGNVQLDYKLHFLPDLHANLNVGLDKSHGEGTIFVPAEAASDFNHHSATGTTGGRFNQYEQTKTNKLFEFYLNYVKDLSVIKSRVDAVAGYSWQDWKTETPTFPDLAANKTDTVGQAGIPGFTQNTLISFYGRLNYSLMNRYLFTFTMRRDGSSRFSKDNRWGNFPSLALAWNIKEESFLRNVNAVSALKLRLGWGITGQQDGIPDYGYQQNFFYGNDAAQYQFGNNYFIVARPQAYDQNLKWEETNSRNVGLDMGFVNNRINVSVDYYNRSTKDLLALVPAPAGTNFSNEIVTNIGSTKSQGLEFGLNVNPINTRNFHLDVAYNLTYIIQYDITKLQLVNDPNYLGAEVGSIGINGWVQRHTVGYRPYTFFLYKQIYDKSGLPIEGLYEDKNRDGKIDDLDKYWVHNPEPKVYMGFSSSASYKKFGAGFTMRASIDNYMFNNVKAGSGILVNVLTGQNYLNNAHSDVLASGFKNRQTWSDYYLENASFLRMDNLYLNYNVGKIMDGRASLKVNVNVQNVFVITKYTGLDPEVSGGIDGTIYPRPRMYSLGLNLDF
jgi:TonB-dependent starch-binding outer membrane protein SusC